MFTKRIVLILMLITIGLTPLYSRDSANLEKVVIELEKVIEAQTRLLKEQQIEIDNLVILSREQVQELSEVTSELKESQGLVGEQKIEIGKLQNLQIGRQNYWLNYAKVSRETIEALQYEAEIILKKLAKANTVKDLSIIGNILQAGAFIIRKGSN